LPRSSGTYNLPAGNPVVNGTPISSTWANSTLTDIANEITNSLPRDGSAPPTANIPMGNFKLIGLANGTLAQDAVTLSQLQSGGSQWLTSGVTPTFVNTTSFTLAGDQTGQFQVGRRLKLTETAGTVYGYILTSIFTSITTVTVVLDSGVLDSGLNQVQYGILTPNNSSIPSKLTVQSINTGRASIVQNATTMDLFALSNIIDGTGSAVTITAIVNAPQAGATRSFYPIVGTTITNNAMFSVDGGASYTTLAGDRIDFEAITTSTYKVHINKFSGALIGSSTSIPTTGTYTSGDIVIDKTSVLGEISGWKRVTTGSGHVLGTDWVVFGGLGVGQTWQDVTASRAKATTYTNSTGKPIMVNITLNNGASGSSSITVNGLGNVAQTNTTTAGQIITMSTIVPNGQTYIGVSATGSVTTWMELR
jgi:hypothetical protein